MEKLENLLPDYKQSGRRSKERAKVETELFFIPDQVKDLGLNRKYYLRTYGCQANERDGETIAGILEMMAFTATDKVDEADFILLNTCAVRANAENKVLGELASLKRLKTNNPDLIMGLCGCMAQEEKIVETILEKYHHVDLVFGTHNIHRLPILLEQTMMMKERTIEVFSKQGDIIENLPVSRFGSHKAWVNIMYGCDKFCSYCIVPYTRGKERSRLMVDILAEVQELKSQNYKEVTLLGQNVNSYGKDIGTDFGTLLEEVAKIGIERVRFTTSHPWDFSDKMIEVIAQYDNLMPYIHLPVQSGNNQILKRMGRRYTVEQYKEIYDKLRAIMPDCAFSTDIIVGFPGETAEQFNDTLEIVNYCKYDNAYTFIYSPRENTPAAKMKDDVSEETKKERLMILNQLCNKYALERNQAYLGRVVKVLVDGPSKKNKAVYCGYSESQKLVNFTAEQEIQVGEIVDVKITEIRTWSLFGKKI